MSCAVCVVVAVWPNNPSATAEDEAIDRAPNEDVTGATVSVRLQSDDKRLCVSDMIVHRRCGEPMRDQFIFQIFLFQIIITIDEYNGD